MTLLSCATLWSERTGQLISILATRGSGEMIQTSHNNKHENEYKNENDSCIGRFETGKAGNNGYRGTLLHEITPQKKGTRALTTKPLLLPSGTKQIPPSHSWYYHDGNNKAEKRRRTFAQAYL